MAGGRFRASPASFGLRTRVRQTLAVARQSLAEVMSGRAFQVALRRAPSASCCSGAGTWATRVFDTSTWPVTHLVAETVLSRSGRPSFPGWSSRSTRASWCGRTARSGAAEIADAAPVPDGVALLGRFLALVAIIVAFQAAFMVGGILLQALQGYYDFELGLYLRILFGLNLADYVLLAALAMTVHVLVNHKYVGHIVVLMASVFQIAAAVAGIHPHHLLRLQQRPRAGRTRT